MAGPFESRRDCLRRSHPRPSGSREEARDDIEPRLTAWAQSAFLAARLPFHFVYESANLEVISPDPHNVFVFPESVTIGLRWVLRQSPSSVTTGSRRPTPVLANAPDGHAGRTPSRTGGRTAPRDCLSSLKCDRVCLPRQKGHADNPGSQWHRPLDPQPSVVAVRPADRTKGLDVSNPKPLTGEELAWMRAVIFRLTHRVGEQGSGPPLAILTLADFPSLR